MSEVKSYFTDIKSHIVEELQKANLSVYIAVAWFTDSEIFDILVSKASLGVKVEILLVDDEINANSKIIFEKLFENGGKVWKIDREQNTMHNKFCVIDQDVVINGSYNWTNKAVENHENIMIVSGDEETALNYLTEFNQIKRKFLGTLTEAYLKLAQRLTVLSILLTLKDKEDIIKQGEKIKELSLFVNKEQYLELKTIVNLCEKAKYEEANNLIFSLIQQTSNYKENSLDDYDTIDDYSDGLALVSKSGKYGYIDKLGKEAIPLQFDSAFPFVNNIARVNSMQKVNFINKTGQMLFDNTSQIAHAKWHLVSVKNKYGICDEFGRMLRDIIYSEVSFKQNEYLSEKEYRRINLDNKVNLISIEGDFLFEDDIEISGEYFYRQYLIISRIGADKNYSYYLEVIEADNGLNSSNEKYGVLTQYGFFKEEWFDSIYYDLNSDELLKVSKNGKWNIINLFRNSYTFEEWADEILLYADDYVKIKRDENWNICDLNKNKYLLNEWYYDAYFFDNKHQIVTVNKDDKFNLVNLNSNSLMLNVWVDNIKMIDDNLLEVKLNGKFNFFDSVKFELLLPDWVEHVNKIRNSNYLLSVQQNNKFNLFNVKTKTYQSDWINDFKVDDVLASRSIRIGTKWFYLLSE